MKFIKSNWTIPGLFVLIFLSCICYDRFFGLNDGFIKGIAFKRALGAAALLPAFFWICILGIRKRNKYAQNISLFIISLAFCLSFLEFLASLCFHTGIIEGNPPKHHLFTDASDLNPGKRPFWGDYNPHFAKWYLPNDTLKRINCQGDSLFSYTNSFGARDKERQKQASGKRAVLLGDSFIEGFMVNAGKRMSDLLEDSTGSEHLNFGINGTSPINYYLTYKHLADQFDHDVLLVGILPANDFEDFTSRKKASLVETPIYRPYWEGVYPDYQLRYSLASISQSAHSLYHFNEPREMSMVIDSVFSQLPVKDKIQAFLQDNIYTWHLVKWIGEKIRPAAPATFTRFNTYSLEEWNIFSYSLERLLDEAGDKKVILLLLPILADIKAYDANRENRLAGALDSLVKDRPNVGMIDFLPVFHQQTGKWEDLYVQCDGHWSEKGEEFAAGFLLNHPLYKTALPARNEKPAIQGE